MEFLDVTEIEERGLRRLAQSRGVTLAKNDESYRINGAGIGSISLSDEEAWSVLSKMTQLQTLGGKGRCL